MSALKPKAGTDSGLRTRIVVSAFAAHAAELRRYLFHRVANRQDADDLAQEVYARLLRVKDCESISHPLAYLLGIAAHVVREFRQRNQRQCVTFDSEMAESFSEFAAGSPLTGAVTASGTEQLELQNWLDRSLAQLPPTHRQVLLLVKRDGLSYEEAAAASGLSVHTIEKYLVEARARMRALLGNC
jgi:RNA polymerase sigma-70 factor (ECF subfamily)